MVTTQTSHEEFQTPHSAINELIHRNGHGNGNWKSRGAVFGLLGGFIALLVGSVITLISWFSDPVWHGIFMHQAATSLFVLGIPLLIFGAHCLDLIDRENKLAGASQRNRQENASADEKTKDHDLE